MENFFNRYHKMALIGLSGNPKSFSRGVYKFLLQQGCDIYPVNPGVEEVEGQKCYRNIESLPEVEAVLFFTNPLVTLQLLPSCSARGFCRIWFQQGAADDAVLNMARELNLDYVNSCVYLHHDKAGFPHNLHRFINRTFKIEQ